jgi:hypothetical protein
LDTHGFIHKQVMFSTFIQTGITDMG